MAPDLTHVTTDPASTVTVPLSAVKTPTPEMERIVMAITRELFPGAIEIEDATDPEDPSRTWKVVVQTGNDIPTVMATKSTWHRRIVAALGIDDSAHFTICVVPNA